VAVWEGCVVFGRWRFRSRFFFFFFQFGSYDELWLLLN